MKRTFLPYGLALLILLVFGCKKESELEPMARQDLTLAAAENETEQHLQNLAVALQLALEDHPDVRLLIYQEAIEGVELYYYISFDNLFQLATSELSVDFRQEMNAAYADFIEGDPQTDYYGQIESYFQSMGAKDLHIALPYLDLAYPRGNVTSLPTTGPYAEPMFGTALNAGGYPANQIVPTDGEIMTASVDKATAKLVGILIPSHIILDHCYMNGNECYKTIAPCAVTGPWGKDCPPTGPSPGGIPFVQGTLNFMNYEIEIKLSDFMYYDNYIGGNIGDCDYIPLPCRPTNPQNGPFTTCENYGRLSAIPGMDYYKIVNQVTGCNGCVAMEKVPPTKGPIQGCTGNNNYFDDAYHFILCQTYNRFLMLGEGGAMPKLGMGGVYKIGQPGTNLPELYFAFPYGKHMWQWFGPDARLHFLTTESQTPCSPLISNLDPAYKTIDNTFYSTTIPSAAGNPEVIATTNGAAILNYWQDNAVEVGLVSGGNGFTDSQNIAEFYASSNPPSNCGTTNLTHLVTLTKLANATNDTYVVLKPIPNSTLTPGTEVTIRVQATFDNGESIDECKSLTLGPSTFNYTEVTVSFRGKLASTYQVDVYSEVENAN